MNNKQQTAVDWLYNNLKSHFKHDGDLLEAVQMSYEQAKEMEKEQIVNTWSQATSLDYEIGLLDASYILCQIHNAEQYYKETYTNGLYSTQTF
jgi:hypothetical protein